MRALNVFLTALAIVLVMPGGLLVVFAWPRTLVYDDVRQTSGDMYALTLGAIMVLLGGVISAHLLVDAMPGLRSGLRDILGPSLSL